MSYDWPPTFLFFGQTGAGKTRFVSHFLRYDLTIEIADFAHGLTSFVKEPPPDRYFGVESFEDLVIWLAGIEERNSDVLVLDDVSFLNYKLTMESAQLRSTQEGKRDELPADVKRMIQSGKYIDTWFIPPRLKDRGVASEKIRIMLYNMLKQKKIIVLTCGDFIYAEKYQENIKEDPIIVGPPERCPMVPGKLANELPYFMSEIFYFYISASANETVYKIRTRPDGSYLRCPKDRSDKMSTLPGWSNGVLRNDKEGKMFDAMIQALPWPEGRQPQLL